MLDVELDGGWKQAVLACIAGPQTNHLTYIAVARTMNASTMEVGDAFLKDAAPSRDWRHQGNDNMAMTTGGSARISLRFVCVPVGVPWPR